MFALLCCCSIPCWLAWLLSGLLGLGLGYLLWARYKKMVADLESQINNYELKLANVGSELDDCKKMRMEAEGNISLMKGRMREIEASASANIGAVAVPSGTGDQDALIKKMKLKIENLEGELTSCREMKDIQFEDASKLRNELRSIHDSNSDIPVGMVSNLASSSESQPKAAKSSDTDKFFAVIGHDKLQVIEGIGPKMEEVLNENGIRNFATLHGTSKESLRDILGKYGDKYRIIDPNTWPQQAGLANDRKWNDLIELQKTLDTGRSDTATDGNTDSKLEKYLIKVGAIRRWAQDDLKAVEGIGPKIEELLHAAGITTWVQLSETEVSRIQDVLTAAGPRFALADPATWPKQSGMAAQGLWDELAEYQDFLNHGKEK